MRLMLSNELPAYIDPEKLCRNAPPQGTDMAGLIYIRKLSNLNPELKAQGATPISVTMNFSVDEEGYCRIKGELNVALKMNCQRCLELMTEMVNGTFLVSPVVSDVQAGQLPDRYEPLIMRNGEVDLAEWIAEELHLALPFVPRHDADCVGRGT